MLRSFGAKDIKCQEIFSLDDEMLGFIPCVLLHPDLNMRTDSQQEAHLRPDLSLSI